MAKEMHEQPTVIADALAATAPDRQLGGAARRATSPASTAS